MTGDGEYIAELVCRHCYASSYNAAMDWLADNRITFDQDMGEL